jgi:hypothetical protein
VDTQCRNTSIEGTEEHKLFAAENKYRFDVIQHLRRQGRWGGQGPISIDKFFPYQDLVPNEDGKKMNFVFYAYKIYRPLLFPYSQALQQTNPSKQVFIQEDNAGPHIKARLLLKPQIQELGI